MVSQPRERSVWSWVAAVLVALALVCLFLAPAGGLAQEREKPATVGVKKDYGRLENKWVVKTREALMYRNLVKDPAGGEMGDGTTQEKAHIFSVFFEHEDKVVHQNKDGKRWILIGDWEGKEKRYILETEVERWDTRLLLKLRKPDGKRAFSVKVKAEGGQEGTFTMGHYPPVFLSYAFILKPPPEVTKVRGKRTTPTYDILFCTGVGEGEGGVEQVKKKQIGLEIVFVLESSDFMLKTFPGSDKNLLGYLKDIVNQLVAHLAEEKDLAGAVRLGFVQYWDNVPWSPGDKRLDAYSFSSPEEKKRAAELLEQLSPRFPASIGCELTEDPALFLDKINSLKATRLYDDWPDDVMAGLVTGVDQMKWGGKDGNKQTLKHLILIGSSSFQMGKKSENVSQFTGGRENAFTRQADMPRGYNSTGLTINQLHMKARPAAGKVEEFSQKYFSALFLPNESIDLKIDPVTKGLDDTKLGKLTDLVKRLAAETDDKAMANIVEELLKDFTREQIGVARRKLLIDFQASRAEKQYNELCKGGREEYSAFFRKVEPSAAKVKEAADALALECIKALRAAKALRENKDLDDADYGDLSQQFFTIDDEFKSAFKKVPASLKGQAQRYDKGGKEVADETIMVMREEFAALDRDLTLLLDELDKIGAQRKSRDEVRRQLLTTLGALGLGQKRKTLDKDTLDELPLKALISELPLRSPAFEVTLDDITSMSGARFATWVQEIRDARKLAESYHTDTAKHTYYQLGFPKKDGTYDERNQYTFVPLHMMP